MVKETFTDSPESWDSWRNSINKIEQESPASTQSSLIKNKSGEQIRSIRLLKQQPQYQDSTSLQLYSTRDHPLVGFIQHSRPESRDYFG